MKLFMRDKENYDAPGSVEGKFLKLILQPRVALIIGALSAASILISDPFKAPNLFILVAVSAYFGAIWQAKRKPEDETSESISEG